MLQLCTSTAPEAVPTMARLKLMRWNLVQGAEEEGQVGKLGRAPEACAHTAAGVEVPQEERRLRRAGQLVPLPEHNLISFYQ